MHHDFVIKDTINCPMCFRTFDKKLIVANLGHCLADYCLYNFFGNTGTFEGYYCDMCRVNHPMDYECSFNDLDNRIKRMEKIIDSLSSLCDQCVGYGKVSVDDHKHGEGDAWYVDTCRHCNGHGRV